MIKKIIKKKERNMIINSQINNINTLKATQIFYTTIYKRIIPKIY